MVVGFAIEKRGTALFSQTPKM